MEEKRNKVSRAAEELRAKANKEKITQFKNDGWISTGDLTEHFVDVFRDDPTVAVSRGTLRPQIFAISTEVLNQQTAEYRDANETSIGSFRLFSPDLVKRVELALRARYAR